MGFATACSESEGGQPANLHADILKIFLNWILFDDFC